MPKPPIVSYAATNAVYTRGTAITPNTPTDIGGAATSYAVAPPLPAGLSLNSTTGAIGGTPTAVAAQATYTVTASNAGGSGTAAITITINDMAPSGLGYAANPVTYAVGAAVTPNVPSWGSGGGTPTGFSMTGALPQGLSLDPTSGVISGTPATQRGYPSTGTYQITASNTGGSTSTSLNITLIPPAPSITTQPANQSVGSGISTYVYFGVDEPGGILTYQWYKNGVAISGSNASVYVTPVLTSSDNLDQFYASVSDTYGRSVISSVATLTIKGVSGTFVNTGTPGVAREAASATLLHNGKVLIAGGRSGNLGLDSAELYDPVAGSFTATGPMNIAHVDHTATLLSNGQVLIAGGYNFDNSGNIATLATAELYDPGTGNFSLTGSLGISRYAHSATLLASGKVLIAGGNTPGSSGYTTLASAELYDPVAGTFSATGSLNTSRTAPAVLLSNGQVLVVGGTSLSSGTLASAEIYDPIAGTFAFTGSLSTARNANATILQNGKVLVPGGLDNGNNVLATAEIYDPSTGTFSATGSLNEARSSPATLLNNGQVLLVGGEVAGPAPQAAEVYDPASGTFILDAPTNAYRFFLTTTLLSSGQVLIDGQETSAITITQPVPAELYKP